MKNKDLFALYHGLEAVSKLGGARFSYGVSKNKKIIIEEIKTIEETNKLSDEFKAYDAARIELCKEMSHKDEKGEAKMIGGNFDIIDRKAFDKAFEELKAEHQVAFDGYLKQQEDYNTLLDQESTIELFKIKQDILPEEMTSTLLDPIFAVIE